MPLFDPSLPEEFKTGTMLDEYMIIYKGVMLQGKILTQFGEYKEILTEASGDFQRKFKIGQPGGLTDGLFMTWLHLDFRFGKTQETICERFLQEQGSKLNHPGPTCLRHLADSYCTLYQLKSYRDERIVFEEIMTGKEWTIIRVNEPFELKVVPGNIWYVRLVGTPEQAFVFIAPFIFPAEAKDDLVKLVRVMRKDYEAYVQKTKMAPENIFKNFSKASLMAWAEYLMLGKKS